MHTDLNAATNAATTRTTWLQELNNLPLEELKNRINNHSFGKKLTRDELLHFIEKCDGDIHSLHLHELLNYNELTRPIDGDFISIIQKCCALQTVYFTKCEVLQQSDIEKFIPHWRNIRVIHFNGCIRINDAVLALLAENCSQLKSIGLGGCELVTDEGIKKLAGKCQYLAKLHLNGCKKVGDAALQAIFANCQHLSKLSMPDTAITDHGLTVDKELPHLKALSVNATRVTDSGLKEFTGKCANLQYVAVGGSQFSLSEVGLKAIALNCPKLRIVDFSYTYGVTDGTVQLLAEKCLDLENLILTCCSQVSDEGVKAIAAKSLSLKGIDLEGTRVTSIGIMAILNLSKLDWINRDGLPISKSEIHQIRPTLTVF